jgi:hypothetical protein
MLLSVTEIVLVAILVLFFEIVFFVLTVNVFVFFQRRSYRVTNFVNGVADVQMPPHSSLVGSVRILRSASWESVWNRANCNYKTRITSEKWSDLYQQTRRKNSAVSLDRSKEGKTLVYSHNAAMNRG